MQQHPGLMTRRCVSLIGACVLAFIGACSKDALGPNASGVESIQIAPATATVAVGSNLTLSAEVRDADGNLFPSPRISWASADPSIASVSSAGVVTGIKVGTVLVAASSRGKDAFARITVNPTPVASIRLSATQRSMFVGQTEQLVAEPLDGSGRVLAGRPVTWSSSNPTAATVTDAGVVTAHSAGATFITASSEGKSATASITVALVPVARVDLTPTTLNVVVGQTTQLTARLQDASGTTITGRAISWSSNRATVATVTSDGLVSAVAAGTATITATAEGKTASTTVNVSPRPVSAVIVSPSQVTIFARQTVQLSALVTDDRGQVLTGKSVAFTSNDPQIATVSASGLVTGVAQGVATIVATSEGATGSATVTIAPDPVAAVDVTPSSWSLIVGQTFQLAATPKSATGQPLTGRTVTWSSGSPALASVSSTGVVTAHSPGNAVIIASVEGKQGSATIQVRAVPVASVTVSPSTASLTAGQAITLTATTLDANGITLVGRIVGWTSSDNAVATVSATGVVTGVSTGSATISASSEGQTGTATVTVGVVPVASVMVSPTQSNVAAGQTTQLTATPMDASNQVLTGRTVTWSSASPGVASVSGTGQVTGVSIGSAVISATIDGVVGSATVTVVQAPAASVTVAPATASIAVGASSTLTATARDASGTVIAGAPISWSSSDPAVATVSSSGVVTGVAPGSVTITAASGSASGTAAVSVTPPPIAKIVLTPSSPRVDEGQTLQLTATAYDANNNVIPGVTFTWTSSNTGRATVDNNGLVTGIRDGNVTITASAGGKSGSVSVRVED